MPRAALRKRGWPEDPMGETNQEILKLRFDGRLRPRPYVLSKTPKYGLNKKFEMGVTF
jgi:hypothetical protein